MRLVYFSILLLTVYGDFAKRVLSPSASVAFLYGAALAVALWMIALPKMKMPYKAGGEARVILGCFIFILLLYIFHLLVALARGVNFSAISSALYICIPVFYSIAILKFYPQFNVVKLAQIFLILMIPVNAVGLIQYFVNPDFLISTAYAATGGIIERNLLETGTTFLRFPSIYVSADRYSALGLTQCFFALMVGGLPGQRKRPNIFWVLLGFAGGIIALLVSGARSRILITLVLTLLFTLTAIRSLYLRGGRASFMRKLVKRILIGVFLVVPALFFLIVCNPQLLQYVSNYQVIDFLIMSFHEGNVTSRIDEAASLSLLPENISLFGEGLGSLSGKPGEFGIMSMWSEGGLVFGGLTLVAFIVIILNLTRLAVKSFLKGEPSKTAVFAFPALVLSFGLLTGLTGVLEFSSGILLMVSLAAAMKYAYIKPS